MRLIDLILSIVYMHKYGQVDAQISVKYHQLCQSSDCRYNKVSKKSAIDSVRNRHHPPGRPRAHTGCKSTPRRCCPL